MKQKIQCVNEKRGDFEKNYKDQYIFGQTNQRKKKWIQINKICNDREGRTLQQTIKNSMNH